MPRAPWRRRKPAEPADKPSAETPEPQGSGDADPAKPGRSAGRRAAAQRRRAERKAKKARSKGKTGKKPARPFGVTAPKRLRRPQRLQRTKKPKSSKPAKARRRRLSGRPRLPEDAAFRASTRVKAVGYGGRELAWKLSRGVERRVESPARGFASRRNARTRRLVAGGGLLLVLSALLLHTPVPGVPCSVSAVKECAPEDNTLAMVPSDALVYGHLTLDTDTAQFQRLDSIVGGFSAERTDQLGTALLPDPSGVAISFAKDIRPWAGDDAALVITPGAAGAASSRAFVISVADRKGADAFLAKIAPGAGTQSKVGATTVTVRTGSLASAYDGDYLVVGGEAAVRAIAGTGTKGAKSLGEEPIGDQIRDQLPDNRFADLYVSGAGIRGLLATSTTTSATQLETFVDYGASKGFAVGAVAEDDGVELSIYSLLDPGRQKTSPSLFTSLPHFRPALTRDIGARALGYIGIGEAGKTLGTLLQRAGGASPGLATSLKAFQDRLATEAKIDPGRDLLPALGGQAALVAEPTDGIPFASLIVDDVDEAKAKAALAQLQTPLVAALQGPTGEPLPGFQAVTLQGGVEASQLQVSPTINLTYAVFDGKLVVSTQPTGVEQVASGEGDRLGSASTFEGATQPLPPELSALVYFNLDELLDLAEALGRTEDPLYVSFRDDIRKLHALAVGVDAGEHDLSSKLFVEIK